MGLSSSFGPGGAGGTGTRGGGDGADSAPSNGATAGHAATSASAGGGAGGSGFGGGGGASTGGGGGGGYGAGGGGAGGGGGGSSWATPNATSVSSGLAAQSGDGSVTVSYDTNVDSCTTVLPGNGIVAAPATGTADLAVSVSLAAPSTSTVTVAWNTLFVPGQPTDPWLGPEALVTDYTPSTGTVTFTPGQTSALIHIPVLADSRPESPDEYLIVSFHDPTHAHLGGFWGLGFGVITPVSPRHLTGTIS
jgi:hypothetical protein